jgi:hypothetical protein
VYNFVCFHVHMLSLFLPIPGLPTLPISFSAHVNLLTLTSTSCSITEAVLWCHGRKKKTEKASLCGVL